MKYYVVRNSETKSPKIVFRTTNEQQAIAVKNALNLVTEIERNHEWFTRTNEKEVLRRGCL